MSLERILSDLEATPGFHRYDPLLEHEIQQLERQLGFPLPASFRQLLSLTNGCEAFYGHFRIFGMDESRAIDIRRWNEHEYWKFAFGDPADSYFCFGETGFGDQFAFRCHDLGRVAEPSVYYRHHFSMAEGESEEPWWESFPTYFESDFARQAKEPYSSDYKGAYRTIQPLDLGDHVVFVPPFLLRDPYESCENAELQIVSARTAMVINGDISLAWDEGCEEGRPVERLEPYIDEQNRTRMRLIWGPSPYEA